MDGAIATSRFGGTSMAAPVAAGNLALMYQAWYERTGKWPTFEEAKAILMGSAKNTNHDVWSQGAGLVNATVGVEPVFATPVEWSVGDYRGKEYEAFAHIIGAGDRDTETFTIHNYSVDAPRPRSTGILGLNTTRSSRLYCWFYTFIAKLFSLLLKRRFPCAPRYFCSSTFKLGKVYYLLSFL